jgi:uncharacterized protein YndB with AHSA1/START domain
MPEPTRDSDLGTLDADGDDWMLTFTRRFPHPLDKVWRAVTEPEHLAAWFPQKIVGELRAGAPLRFVSTEGPDDGFDGEMLAFDPPTLMEMRWGTDFLRIELRPDGDGTVMTFVDTFSELGKAARDAAGWHACLDRLAGELDGRVAPEASVVWKQVHPAYVDALGPDASTIGPPSS